MFNPTFTGRRGRNLGVLRSGIGWKHSAFCLASIRGTVTEVTALMLIARVCRLCEFGRLGQGVLYDIHGLTRDSGSIVRGRTVTFRGEKSGMSCLLRIVELFAESFCETLLFLEPKVIRDQVLLLLRLFLSNFCWALVLGFLVARAICPCHLVAMSVVRKRRPQMRSPALILVSSI